MENFRDSGTKKSAGHSVQNDYSVFTRAISNDELYTGENYTLKICGQNQKLLIFNHIVLWLTGGVLSRKLTFETPILDCFFTRFNDDEITLTATANDILVVVFEDKIKVYKSHGPSNVINFPINIKNAFPTSNGIIVSRKYDLTMESQQSIQIPRNSPIDSAFPLNSPLVKTSSIGNLFLPSLNTNSSMSISTSSFASETNFLTLSDTFGEMGLVVSSSTTSFGYREELTSYPSTISQCLATTFNPIDKKITIYHVRKLAKKVPNGSKRLQFQNLRKQSKRISSTGSVSTNTVSLNKVLDYESKNTRAVSNPLLFDRIASGADFSNDTLSGASNLADSLNYKKDIIFTKLEFFSFDSDPSKLKIFNIDYGLKEAIVIVNLEQGMIEILIFTKESESFTQPRLIQSYSITGVDAVEFITEDQHKGYIVVLKPNGEIFLCNIFYEIFSNGIQIQITPSSNAPISLDSCLNYNLLFKADNGEHYTYFLAFRPNDKLVKTLIESLKYLIHDKYFELFWLQWWSNSMIDMPNSNDWNSYLITLLSFCIPDQQPLNNIQPLNEISSLSPYIIQAKENTRDSSHESGILAGGSFTIEADLLAKIVLSIHVIREDMKLNVLAKNEMKKLSLLLAQLISWLRWPDNWLEYYGMSSEILDKGIQLNAIFRVLEPPNVLLSLSSLFTDDELVQYLPFSVLASEDELLDSEITPRTFHILRLFEILVTPSYSNYDLIQAMVEYGINLFNLETYPSGIYMVLKNTLLLCRETFTSHNEMSKEMITLIGRLDLLQFQNEFKPMHNNRMMVHHKQLNSSITNSKLMADIINPIFNDKVLNPWDGEAEAEIFNVTKLLFSHDRRFYDVTKILQTSKTQKINYDSDTSLSHDDSIKLEKQRYIASKISLRTMTTPIGRGAVFTNSRKPLITEGFPIPKMNFNTTFIPDDITVTIESVQLSQDLTDWGYFHNGASSGLTVSKKFNEISGSWVVFNRPPQLNAQHAGFLLGLGLNGHLKKLEEWHIYNYLSPKHSFTSIAMLLGMSASLRGTMDLKLTKVLSIHVVALLPQGSTNLNVKLPVQTAGLIGIGLLYLGTQHRRMTEMLLSQISSTIEINDKKIVSEAYQLAAGIALGYVNLRRGNELKYNNDSHVVDSLITFATSIRDVETPMELEKSCCGAIMSLMFMFFKTDNEEIAKKLKIPETLQLMDYIRPDLFLLRVLSFNMIMWDGIRPSRVFVENQIPNCLKESYNLEEIYDLDIDSSSYMNILGGVLLSIGVKFASSGNSEAKETLMYYLDKLIILGSLEAEYYDEKVALLCIRNVRDVVSISLSLVMAGTGDLDVLKRLRYLHDRVDENTNYGNYMAVNTSLGFLFLGGGQQAFKVNDLFSNASLITSIYPIYGTNNYGSRMGNNDQQQPHPPQEDMEIHLQALRHFWSLSVENRCLIVKDINNGNPIEIGVNIYLKNRQIETFQTPCLLPEIGTILKIVTERTHEYLPVEFNFETANLQEIEKFKENFCLYVNNQANYNTLKLNFHEIVSLEDDEQETPGQLEKGIINKFKTVFENLSDFESKILFEMIQSKNGINIIEMTVFDFKRELKNLLMKTGDLDSMLNLRLIFKFVDKMYLINSLKLKYSGTESEVDPMNLSEEDNDQENEGDLKQLQYLSKEFINSLKNELYLKLE